MLKMSGLTFLVVGGIGILVSFLKEQKKRTSLLHQIYASFRRMEQMILQMGMSAEDLFEYEISQGLGELGSFYKSCVYHLQQLDKGDVAQVLQVAMEEQPQGIQRYLLKEEQQVIITVLTQLLERTFPGEEGVLEGYFSMLQQWILVDVNKRKEKERVAIASILGGLCLLVIVFL